MENIAAVGSPPSSASNKVEKSQSETEATTEKNGEFNFVDYLLGLQIDTAKQGEEAAQSDLSSETPLFGQDSSSTKIVGIDETTGLDLETLENLSGFPKGKQGVELMDAGIELTKDVIEQSLELEPEADPETEFPKVFEALKTYESNSTSSASNSEGAPHTAVLGSISTLTELPIPDLSGVLPVGETATANMNGSVAVPKLFESVQSLIHQGGGKMTVALNPEHLGQMEIEVQTAGREVTIEMLSESSEAKSVVEDNLLALRSALADQDLSLAKFEINLASNSGWNLENAQSGGSEWGLAKDQSSSKNAPSSQMHRASLDVPAQRSFSESGRLDIRI